MNIGSCAKRPAWGRGFVCLCTAVLCGFGLAAEAANPTAGPGLTQNQRLKNAANAEFGLFDSEIVVLEISNSTPGVRQRIDVPLDGWLATLDVWPHSVRASDYRLYAQIETGEIVEMEPGPVRTVRGLVIGEPGSLVAGGVTDEGLSATIIYADGSRSWIEPLAGRVAGAPFGTHVVYHNEDVIPSNGECGNDNLPKQALDVDNDDEIVQYDGEPLLLGVPERTELAADADFEYFQDYGSVAAVENRINLVTNTMNPQYESQVNITHCITAIIVRETSADPYSATSSGALLCQFITEWTNNQQGVAFDVAKLFTGKNIDGGIIGQAATFGDICDRQGCCGCGGGGLDDGAFCHSENDCCGSLGCATDLMAHELGHLWDAFHCDPCNTTMRSFIGCFNVFGPATISSIVAHRNSRACLDTDTCGAVATGACCFGDGTCDILSSGQCGGAGGVYEGDDTSCSPTLCPVLTACCLADMACVDNQTIPQCTAQGGNFQGDGTDCGTIVCTGNPDSCLGATGVGSNSSNVINNAAATPTQNDGGPGDPELPGGSPSCQWNGVPSDTHNTLWYTFVACDTSIQIETCTTTDVGDTIIALYSGNCGSLNELACGEDDCGSSTYESRICYDGLVAGQTYRIMVGNPGTWSGSTPGSINLDLTCPCPDVGPSNGACCFDDGSCSVATSADCSTLGGNFQGNGTSCAPNNCPQPMGACCFPDESCSDFTPAQCTTFGGDYQGDGTSCTPNPCIAVTGACCLVGSCFEITVDDCTTFGGDYSGDGTDCGKTVCEAPTGACCFADGTCTVVTADDCTNSGGTYSGDNTSCSPNNCPQPPATGACCSVDGTCNVLTQVDCVTAGGTYSGDNTSCSPNNCPQPPATGACCSVDGTCNVLTQVDCVTAGGTYSGDNTSCSPNNCPQPPATGACCSADGTCNVQTQVDCVTAGGTYSGDNTSCSPNNCPQPPATGACCSVDGTCNVQTQVDCVTAGGTYSGDNTSCSPNNCPQPPATGACCSVDGTCNVQTQVDCATAGGNYSGDNTSCSPNNCPQPPDCPADLDGNLIVDFQDLLLLLAAWGGDGAGADIAEPLDLVDFQDLLGILAAWGPCS